MSLSINANVPANGLGRLNAGLSVQTPKDKEHDAALAAQDSAARTSENAPRAGEHLADLPSPIDRYVLRVD
jgi:hypothetical protein